MKTVFIGVGLLVVLLGCGMNPAGARIGDGGEVVPDTPAIQTGQTSYVLVDEGRVWRLTITATYTNRTGSTVYVRTAGDPRPVYGLEKLENGRWQRALSPIFPLVLSPPVVVRNGGSRTDTLVFFAGKPGGNVAPEFEVTSIPGVYRVLYEAYRTEHVSNGIAELSDTLPVEKRSSNTFELR